MVANAAGAATNVVTAGIGGLDNGTLLGGDGTGPARMTLVSADVALVKQARRLDGTVLGDGADVIVGQELVVVLFVDNSTDAPASDVRIIDPLDESAFVYVTGTLETAVMPAGSGDAAIWAASWSPLSDALGAPDDAGSIADTGGGAGPDRVVFGAEPGQAGMPIDVPAGTLRAFRFHVRVM